MLIWILYDIKKNKQRQKLFSLCRNFGLFPIQKSIFLGIIDDDREKIFIQKVEQLVEIDDSIIILPTNKKNVKESIMLGKKIDLDLPLREKQIMFF